MNKIALSTALLMYIVVPLQSQINKPASSPRPRTAAATNQALEAQIVALEKRGWEAIKNKDYANAASLQAEDYQEIDMDGLRNKVQALQYARNLVLTDYAMSDVKLTMLAKDVALLTYKATETGTFKGQPLSPKPFYFGTLYMNRHGKWLAVFLQETLSE